MPIDRIVEPEETALDTDSHESNEHAQQNNAREQNYSNRDSEVDETITQRVRLPNGDYVRVAKGIYPLSGL